MSTLLRQADKAKDKAKTSARKTASRHEPVADKRQRSVPIDAPRAEEIDVGSRKEILALSGKEIASGLGSRILLAMLAETGLSMREVARRSGFDVSLLSNIAKGKRVSGPELWTLVALADAMDLDLDLSFSRR